jgi:flavin-dependent dehydrogenase
VAHEDNMTPDVAAEICILGGGPAGAIMARRLAELGHDTLLVDRTAGDRPPRAESLAPSILPILDSLQLRGDIDGAIFHRERRALLLWESATVEEKSFATAPSLLVERARLDNLLRQSAVRAGARLIAPASARSPHRVASGWAVPIKASRGSLIIRSTFLVDARGRRLRAGADDGAPRTAAISSTWALRDRPIAETRIEAGADEWYWGSPLPNLRYGATIFLDSARIAGLTTTSRAELYRRLLARSNLLRGLENDEMLEPVSVRDATSSIGRDLIGSDFVRVGEAATAIDPLSSQGIQDAVLSAIQGSAAVHTILSADPAPALEFYRERRQTAAAHGRRTAARFYQTHAGRSSFWLRRASAAAAATGGNEQPARAGHSLPSALRISPAVQIIDAPLLCGALIRRARALSHSRLEHPIAYFSGVELAPLFEHARGTPDQILSGWTRHMPLRTAKNILSWMWAVGILDPQGDRCSGSQTDI